MSYECKSNSAWSALCELTTEIVNAAHAAGDSWVDRPGAFREACRRRPDLAAAAVDPHGKAVMPHLPAEPNVIGQGASLASGDTHAEVPTRPIQDRGRTAGECSNAAVAAEVRRTLELMGQGGKGRDVGQGASLAGGDTHAEVPTRPIQDRGRATGECSNAAVTAEVRRTLELMGQGGKGRDVEGEVKGTLACMGQRGSYQAGSNTSSRSEMDVQVEVRRTVELMRQYGVTGDLEEVA